MNRRHNYSKKGGIYTVLIHTHLCRNIVGWLQRLQGSPEIITTVIHTSINTYACIFVHQTATQNQLTAIHGLFTRGCLRVIRFFPFHLLSNMLVKYSERALRTHRWAVNICPWTRNLTSLCWPCSNNLKRVDTNDWIGWRHAGLRANCKNAILCSFAATKTTV